MGNDKRRFDVLLDTYRGKEKVIFTGLSGSKVRSLVRMEDLKPNDRLRWIGDSVWFFAWQAGLFSAEELAGVKLRDDNLPPSCRGRWEPEPHPFAPHFLDKHGRPFAQYGTTVG